METISDIQKKYSGKIDLLDLELIIADIIGKPREFVMIHAEYEMDEMEIENCKLKIARRRRDEPLAYILGSREFFGLPFLVSPATLIPRPETELAVEMALREMQSEKSENLTVIDVGTGSGNIIISIAKNNQLTPAKFFGIDISKDALEIAKQNAAMNNVSEKIKFLHGNLLEPIMENAPSDRNNSKMIILANLPYLSQEIYDATLPTVQKYEPKSALYSPQEGLAHYAELMGQIKKIKSAYPTMDISCYMEISPEQKAKLPALITKILPDARIRFEKDLAQKWRICKIML